MSGLPNDKSLLKSLEKEVTKPVAKNAEKLRTAHHSSIDAIAGPALKAGIAAIEYKNSAEMMIAAAEAITNLTPVTAAATQAPVKPDPKSAKASEWLLRIAGSNQKKIDDKLQVIEDKQLTVSSRSR